MNQRVREREALVSLRSMCSCLSSVDFSTLCSSSMAYNVSREFIIKPTRTMGCRSLAPSWQLKRDSGTGGHPDSGTIKCFYYTSSPFISQHGVVSIRNGVDYHVSFLTTEASGFQPP